MKFTFKSEFVGFGSPKTEMVVEVDQIDDVLNYFEQFLQGAGYTWIKPGEIQLVREELDDTAPGRSCCNVDMDGRC